MEDTRRILEQMRREPANVRFRVRIPPEVHRALAMQAAEQGGSLNRLASAKLAA